jgi:hypothetical protein
MATLTKTNVSGSTWVLFNQGAHGSLLDPTSNAGVTVEMQCQTVNFLASNGTFLPLGCSKCRNDSNSGRELVLIGLVALQVH